MPNHELNDQFLWQFLTLEQAEFAAQHVLDIFQMSVDEGFQDLESLRHQSSGQLLMLSTLAKGFSSLEWIDKLYKVQKSAVVDQPEASISKGAAHE